MTTSQQLEITFSSGRSGTGPATWGQQAIWDAVGRLSPADAPRYNITTAAPLEPGLPVPVVLDALTDLLHLHDSLHTRLHPDGEGRLRQTVDPEGRLPVHTRHGDGDSAELARTGAAFHDELAALPFDCATEWPVRVGLVVAGGLVRHISLVLSHTALDGAGMGRLAMDLTELSLGSSAEAIRARRPAQQPLEEAAFQQSERGRRRDANARAHVLRKLRSGPPRLFPAARHDEPQPFPNAVLSSPALLRAVELVAAGHRASTSSVLLAATAVMTARLAGSSDAVLQVVVNNRFLPGLTAAVSVVAGDGLLHLPDADGEFAAVVRRTHAASIATYRHAYYDKRLLDEEIARLTAEHGPLADRSCIFNDTRDLVPPSLGEPATPSPGDAAGTASGEPLDPARTTLGWPKEFEPRPGLTYALDALRTPDALQLAMTADGSVLPRPRMERFLYGIEELVVTEAQALALALAATP
ncbi:condensation domain-containing protein [Streptomyces sp. CB01881]|uniref:condensation domain-containing protein n=1 Tax=Streptomyces sp. CB01881 TaxID=2078691 RepID=UPI000CDBC6F2|nr:condensation domain-containing protein [Streptomyces sp. CB01881]AUY52851.1 non-ribosomal peptide synthetase condensation domain protein [Streptomyces sp. CB01881]TYC70569.1 non-ribosomal peptide synthetase condensation domain protein [Streptomyces sp. CB01881]